MTYQKPPHWGVGDNKLFKYRVGFTCPPIDWDAGPSDFLRMSPESVGVHGWMLHVPDYGPALTQRTAPHKHRPRNSAIPRPRRAQMKSFIPGDPIRQRQPRDTFGQNHMFVRHIATCVIQRANMQMQLSRPAGRFEK